MRLTIRQNGREDLVVNSSDDATIMETLALADLRLDAPCGGQGRCGKCLVEAVGDLVPPESNEQKLLKGREGKRLACLAKGAGDVTVVLSEKSVFNAVVGLGWSAPFQLDPVLSLAPIPERDRQDQSCLLSALSLKTRPGQGLADLAKLEADKLPGWLLSWRDELLAAFPATKRELGDAANDKPANLAVALDLGTTGLAAAVIDLDKREIAAMETALNPQTAMGADVISRITLAAASEEDLLQLQDLALEGLAKLIVSAAGGPEQAKKIGGAVISGNTTMLHLLAGVNPKSLAQAPYRPIFTQSLDLSHLSERLNLAPYSRVVTSPSISAYVGGDISAGLIAVKLVERPGTCMFIDIGTNGEIVLSRNGKLVAASCAAGPALEGMNIVCGTRAVTGAVDSFKLNDDLSAEFTTIGGAEPIGICGSGIIDICAELTKVGIIQKSGRLVQPEGLPTVVEDGRYPLTEQVYFCQKDVRQVQLAKGAISAAMKMLLEKLSLSVDDLDEVIIAGSFGFHLRSESLLGISLIPKGYQGPVTFVGNSSLAGSARLLLDRSAHQEIEELVGRVEVMELGFDPKFQDAFLGELSF
ncbi:MAG: ASKHA domain-containing protein [Deltaproteobacteria bacterium]|jgi:uncharacterized 2Fe-2S/4Fe-4S cluster protein (DUF4445 family)|nr:ASKHA domain-containing protein [Deltaproteobacteria bacterium]